MYSIVKRKRVVQTFADISMARNALIDHPEASIVYSSVAVAKYEVSHSILNGESEDGKTKS